MILLRLMAGAGLFAFGYYLGKQVGRMEPIREELAGTRRDDGDHDQTAEGPATAADDAASD